ncbi:DNA-binding response regulator [Motiliproteus coralliicola]|uniref:DNA-binding response regulator n=1 Tax=Motiliproteus coralliicola TaxID=2283196 RepID=A0A369WFL1_9GAMM|nr:response regulator transcription factor [Motiliproteus coralliicola]RDE19386.1 DNA-binding response regulator [Motiliproteus coralliicola]
MRILLVEDDQSLAIEIKAALNKVGYAVELSHDGIDAEFMGNEETFDAIVLDLGLPGRPGLEVLQHWRQGSNDTPVLILTARDNWNERVDGLKAGADDYLGKPFHIEELQARLEAVIRRHHGYSENILSYAGLSLNTDSQQLSATGKAPVQLRGIEYRLMRLLLMNPQRILSKSEITDHIYEEDFQRDSNVVEVYVNKLRQRFGKGLIETHRGQGYKLGRVES